MIGNVQEWTLVVDDIGLRYVIPADRREDWYAWVEACQEGRNECATPDWAHGVNGGDVVFATWRVD